MTWVSVGTVSLTASDFSKVVGTVQLPPSGGLEVRIRQVSPAETSLFRSGRFHVQTTSGRTFGTRRFWGHLEGEDYQLGGDGLTSDETQGQLVIEPGLLNLKALKHPDLSPWVLEVSAQPWQPSGGGGGAGPGTFAGGFVSTTGAGLTFLKVVFP